MDRDCGIAQTIVGSEEIRDNEMTAEENEESGTAEDIGMAGSATFAKRKFEQTDLAVDEIVPNEMVRQISIASSKELLHVKIQSKKYFTFSKRCAKIFSFRQLPKLFGQFNHGGHMYQLAKRDFKEEFELLPRCGQKSASQCDVSGEKMGRRLSRIYSRYRMAFEAPRFLELFRSELGSDIHIACAADVNFLSGHAHTGHLSLGAFARFFGRAYERGHQRILDLNPFEAYFLADCGTVQLTLSHCPMGLEDIRALMESRVHNFVPRYAVFSELQRTTRYQIKRYCEQERFLKGQWVPLQQVGIRSAQHFFEQPIVSSGNHMLENIVPVPVSDEVIHRSGYAMSMLNSVEEAWGMLQLPHGADPVQATGSKSPTDCKTGSVSALPLPNILRSAPRSPYQRKVTVKPFPKGIDMAFYGCEKSMTPVPPAFDIAISDCRDKSVGVSALFDAMEKKKNPRLPVLMERIDCGQLSGYALILTQLPPVQYAGRYTPFVAPSAELFDARTTKLSITPAEPQGIPASIGAAAGSKENMEIDLDNKENDGQQWIPRVLKRRLGLVG